MIHESSFLNVEFWITNVVDAVDKDQRSFADENFWSQQKSNDVKI